MEENRIHSIFNIFCSTAVKVSSNNLHVRDLVHIYIYICPCLMNPMKRKPNKKHETTRPTVSMIALNREETTCSSARIRVSSSLDGSTWRKRTKSVATAETKEVAG